MGVYFGTDGIRGIVNNDLTFDTMYKCGNALTQIKEKPTIIIGRDTRSSGDMVALAVASGAIIGGAKVIDVGIIPTAGVAYLTKVLECDYGIMISASHNPPEFNGIKVFDRNGYKLQDDAEYNIEKRFVKTNIKDNDSIGTYSYSPSYVNCYIDYLIKQGDMLDGLSIVIDGSNGAGFSIAPKVFKMLGAKVYATNCKNNGEKINVNAGSLYPEILKRNVLKYKADVGFAFDGDADRIVAIDKSGEIFDGDKLIYILAKYFSKSQELKSVVGTSLTNIGIEKALKSKDIDLIRADVGDKYVLAEMIKQGCTLGGEQSGHIIDLNLATTGDGILVAVMLSKIIKQCGTLNEMFDVEMCPQYSTNIVVNDKLRIINSEALGSAIRQEQTNLKNGRILVRASGTEPKIRIMVECEDMSMAKDIALRLSAVVKKIN